jgi:hypothetical protein
MQELKETAHRERRPFKDVVNEAIRAGLASRGKTAPKPPKFKLKSFRSRLKAGIDESRLNQLADQLEGDDFLGESLKRAQE